jgi:hypothetical protein
MELPPVATVPAKQTLRIPVTFRTSVDAVRSVPPLIAGRASFEDSRGRSVDVILRARPDVARALSTDASGAAQWPISAWPWTPYDTHEPDGHLSLSRDASGHLWVQVSMPDQLPAGDARADTDQQARRTAGPDANPHNDAVRLEVRSGSSTRSWLVEPHAGVAYGDPIVTEWTLDANATIETPYGLHQGWVLRARLAPEVVADMDGLNAFTADNDLTYHTQWRSLCAPGTYASLDGRPAAALNTPR